MSRTKVNCPNCNSLQPFAPRLRIVGRGKTHEQYAQCNVCGHEIILSQMSENEYRDLQKGIRRANRLRSAARRKGRRRVG